MRLIHHKEPTHIIIYHFHQYNNFLKKCFQASTENKSSNKSKKIDHGILRINIRDVHMKIVINQKTDILTKPNGGGGGGVNQINFILIKLCIRKATIKNYRSKATHIQQNLEWL